MRSTTPERLKLCSSVQPAPPDVQRIVDALWRVTHMRARLMTCLILVKGWEGPAAKDFVQANGKVWQ